MNPSIPSSSAPPTGATPSSSVGGTLAAGASIWLKIINIQPIGEALRPLANQTLEKVIASASNLAPLLGDTPAKTTKGLLPAHQPPSTNTGSLLGSHTNLEPLTRLLQAKQLFILQALVRSQPISLITDQALKPGSQVQLQAMPQGFQLIAKPTPLGASLPNNPPPPSGEPKPTNLSDADRSALNVLLRKALPLQQSSASTVKALDLLLSKIVNERSTNQRLSPPAQKALVSSLQALTQALPLNSSAQAIKSAINNSGVFTEAKLNQTVQTNFVQPVDAKLPPPAPTDTKLQLWQLFAQLSNIEPAAATKFAHATPSTKASGITLQLLNLLGFTAAKTDVGGANKTQYKQVLSEIGKQWLAKITALQLANLVDEPDSQTLKNINIELPIRVEQQVTPLQLQFSKFWHLDEDEKHGAGAEGKDQKREIVWQVTLSIEVETLGRIDARIRYLQQRLRCSLWAEKPATLALVEQEASQLAEAIRQKGLAVEPIHCHAGRMPSPSNRLSQPLLDTHA